MWKNALRATRTLAVLAVLAAAPALGPAPVAAQQPVTEEQVALDESGQLLRIDAPLARRLGLFDGYQGLREVLLFRAGTGFVLEVAMRRDGRIVRERTALGAAAVAALRADISARLAASAPDELLDQSGRVPLLATSTALGLAFYGWAVPSILDVEEFRWQLGLYMVTASASFFGPLVWSRDRPVTAGMANAAFWGGTRGILQGIALHRIVAGVEEPEFTTDCPIGANQCFDVLVENNSYERTRLASAVGFSLFDGVAGTVWADRSGATPGEVHTVGIMADLGVGWGVGLGVLADMDDEDTGLWAMGLGGGLAGLAGGFRLADAVPLTWGDAETVRTGGLLGGFLGAVVTDWTGTEEEKAFAAASVLASAGAAWASLRMVRDREYSPGQGLLVDLGTLASGLLGLGTAVLVGDTDDGTLLLTMTGLGGLAGFVGTNAALAGASRGGSGSGGGDSPGMGSLPFRLQLYPALRATRGGSTRLPPLTLRFGFEF